MSILYKPFKTSSEDDFDLFSSDSSFISDELRSVEVSKDMSLEDLGTESDDNEKDASDEPDCFSREMESGPDPPEDPLEEPAQVEPFGSESSLAEPMLPDLSLLGPSGGEVLGKVVPTLGASVFFDPLVV